MWRSHIRGQREFRLSASVVAGARVPLDGKLWENELNMRCSPHTQGSTVLWEGDAFVWCLTFSLLSSWGWNLSLSSSTTLHPSPHSRKGKEGKPRGLNILKCALHLLRRKELVSADVTLLCLLPEWCFSLMISQWHGPALKAGSSVLLGWDPADQGLTSCVTLDLWTSVFPFM